MTNYREIIRLKSLDFSERNIALSCGVSRNTVAKVLARAAESDISWPLDAKQTNTDLERILFPKERSATNKRMPDYEYIRKELLRNGVTKKLLWIEYCEECRMAGEEPLMHSQFCYYIQQDEQKRRATMRIPRKPGEQAEVDWAGDPARIIDPDTGEIIPAWIFVGVMTYSQYAYVEAFINERQQAWITAHIHMYEYFGGVARVLVPDNCSTAVDRHKSTWREPELNRVYREMAEHYGTAIIPARVRKPKDKPNVEGAVNLVGTWITATLRNEQFFSLTELNAAIRVKLKQFNANLFQKKEGSRISLFLGEEKPLLLPLPTARYELADWKQATVQFNYHIALEKMHYSVPYEFIKSKVDIRITETTIEIFDKQNRIASHRRLTGRPGQYSTIKEHMPPDHQIYLEWNGERFRKWAKQIGVSTYEVVNGILSSGKVEQQFYKSCMGLLKLADKYSSVRLEKACERALSYSSSPSYKSIKNLLQAMAESTKSNQVTEGLPKEENHYGITRGAGYYGGGRHD